MQPQGSINPTDDSNGSDLMDGMNQPTESADGTRGQSNNLASNNDFQQADDDEIVQVVYQSNNSGSLVGIESSLIPAAATSAAVYDLSGLYSGANSAFDGECQTGGEPIGTEARHHQMDSSLVQLHQPLGAVTSTGLPSVAEESSSGAGPNHNYDDELPGVSDTACLEERTSRSISQANDDFVLDEPNQSSPSTGGRDMADHCCVPRCTDYDLRLGGLADEIGTDFRMNPNAIYSTISRRTGTAPSAPNYDTNHSTSGEHDLPGQTVAYGTTDATNYNVYVNGDENCPPNYPEARRQPEDSQDDFVHSAQQQQQQQQQDHDENISRQNEADKKDIEEINAEICQIISRQKQGAVESGSLRNNFKKKKKLVVSTSTNENDLTAHRQKLLDSQGAAAAANNPEGNGDGGGGDYDEEAVGSLPSKFKRTHSVSFNVGSSRNSRHSVDIRNLPSYLTVKRASIVDVAKGAMSSLMHSFGSGTASSSISNSRRDSGNAAAIDEEPIFEEPIAPTLSLGQRVALVKNNGAEFGTVGWIGQLPDVDDDWVVGVIFDNMIGNCDGAYNGIRYFYSRENFAMFVPLSTLTKTDNYIGRPETGTMLSRMSVSLKPGQLISIQRSSLRLQHCFLNAPHQRVGHDVRAVSNRLHCQCHNCGPCAHLTKQHSRVNALPTFGAHHAVNKKNSLAHAAVEILAHHHHHYHEEEHHEEEDYQFGDNSAHACNFVRYSCCQQNGGSGHEFSSDCGLVRPELLDNLIHAPRAPHGGSTRPRRMRKTPLDSQQQLQNGKDTLVAAAAAAAAIEGSEQVNNDDEDDDDDDDDDESQFCSSCSSRSSSLRGPEQDGRQQYSQEINSSYQMDSMNYQFHGSDIYNTLDSKMSLYDQKRFIYQRESSTIQMRSRRDYLDPNHDNEDNESSFGLIPRLKRCFGCLKKRDGGARRKRPKKRKLSARNRLIEYRRKQSTFVPSTLAKPQDDFASHGIVLPTWDSNRHQESYNSDYSSNSKSSGSESPNNSPRRRHNQASSTNHAALQQQQQQQQQFISIGHDVQAPGEQLKSSNTVIRHEAQLNYDDYTFENDDGYRSSYGKFAHSQESDLGYFDLMTNSSGATLKDIVDHAIEREESLQQLAPMENVSPLQSDSIVSNSCCDQVEISSPTVSMVDQNDENQLSDRLDELEINEEHQ